MVLIQQIVVAGHTFFYIAFFFCIGRRERCYLSLRLLGLTASPAVYTNSLLATLNARKMIRGAADGIQSTTDNCNISLSLREFPKSGQITSRVSSLATTCRQNWFRGSSHGSSNVNPRFLVCSPVLLWLLITDSIIKRIYQSKLTLRKSLRGIALMNLGIWKR